MNAPSGHPLTPAQATGTVGRPLTPFEQLMLVDDRPGHPMCFFVECVVDGPLQENRLREAVQAAARRHPVLHSRLGFDRGHPLWLDAEVWPQVIWNPPPHGPDPWRRFDLRRESGVRVVVLSDGEQRHRVVIQVHHSVCDGVAGCEFAGDVWALYAGIEPRAFSQPRAARSGSSAHATPESPAPGAGPDTAREAWSFASFWPTPLSRLPAGIAPPPAGLPPAPCAPSDRRSPPYMWIEIDPVATEALRAAASAGGASLNDLIVAAVMRATLAWNARAGRRSGNVRVTMPVNLRPPGLREPATNHLGYAFLDRTATQCADPLSLAASLAAATRWILDNNAASFFLGILDALARRPWLMRLMTRLPVCISTVVVSNIGDPSRRMRSGVGRVDGRDAPGDVVIRGFFGAPPLRPRTRASIGVTTYAGRLTLCCLCSAHPDPHEGARRFLELVRQELAAIAKAAAGSDERPHAHVRDHA